MYAAKKALWLQWIIGEVLKPLEDPITLYSDSQSVIALRKDRLYHARMKHIDIRYHFIQFEVQKKSIKLIYCPTEDMAANILTKALPNIKVKHFMKALGLHLTWGGVLDIKLQYHTKVSKVCILKWQDAIDSPCKNASCHNPVVIEYQGIQCKITILFHLSIYCFICWHVLTHSSFCDLSTIWFTVTIP